MTMTEEFKRAVYGVITAWYPSATLHSALENGSVIVPPSIHNEAVVAVEAVLRALADPTDYTMDAFRAASKQEWNDALARIGRTE